MALKAALETVAFHTASAGRSLERAALLVREMKEAPPEITDIVTHARAIFDAAPVPIWVKWADGDGRILYSNPVYKATITDYEGLRDQDGWPDATAAEFAANDAAAAAASGGVLAYEKGVNPTTNRGEHWWIAKWRQVVDTADGRRTLVWGALLSTVAHHRQEGLSNDGARTDRRSTVGCGEGAAAGARSVPARHR